MIKWMERHEGAIFFTVYSIAWVGLIVLVFVWYAH